MRHPASFGSIALALALSLAACSGSAPSAKSDGAAAVLVAATKTAEARSSKIEMKASIEAGERAMEMLGQGSFDFTTQDGVVKITLKGEEISDAFSPFDLLFVDDVIFMKFPVNFSEFLPGLKPWIKMDAKSLGGEAGLPGFGSLTSQDPTSALAFLRGAGEVNAEGRESIRGVVTTHYRTTIDLKKASRSAAAGERAGWADLIEKAGLESFPMDVWIDEQGRARRLRFSMEIADLGSLSDATVKGQKGTITVSTDLFDFGVAVKVAAPPAGEVSDYAELKKLGGG